jgi:hypothetical protein
MRPHARVLGGRSPGARGLQLRAGIGDDCTGARRVRDSVRYNDCLELGTVNGLTSLALGSRARKPIEEATTPDVT